MLALAGLEAADEGGGDGLRGGYGGELVGQHRADQARAAVVGAGLHRGEAREGLDDGIVGGLVGVGALLAEAVDGHVDDVGRDFADGGLVEAEPLDHAGAEVLHEHVGAGGEPPDDVGALRSLEVDGERALVAVEVEERGGEAVAAVAVGARVVARARLLDLDDVGALVGQDHGGPGARQHRGEVDDADAGERAGSVACGVLLAHCVMLLLRAAGRPSPR